MLKVFLVEDEIVVRESLRDNIPWNDYGFTFAGEAEDGESALPLIRKARPDVLITDIRMPFMDGLTLCHLVKKEFPSIRIIIMSGYDDFEYARKAIQEGVDLYLLKPITRKSMRDALGQVKEKIDADREQASYVERYRLESHEYEQLQRRQFLEQLFSSRMPLEQLYEKAAKAGLETDAESYNVILFSIRDDDQDADRDKRRVEDSQAYQEAIQALNMFFLRMPAYLMSVWGTNSFLVLVHADADAMERYTRRAVEKIREVCENRRNDLEWYVAAGQPVSRFSQLAQCFEKTNQAFACRFWMPRVHVLTQELANSYADRGVNGSVMKMEPSRADASAVQGFLEDGEIADVATFVEGYLNSLSDVLESQIFRGYLLLNIRFSVIRFVEKQGVSQEAFTEPIEAGMEHLQFSREELAPYLEELIRKALEIRDHSSRQEGSRVLQQAKAYIDAHYTEADMNLESAARAAGVSGSYLSSLFSKETGATFVEYLTAKRMQEAGRLLREEKVHTAEAAAAVGYRDAHYFSYVFRRTMGCTPKEYRGGKA